MRKKKKKAIRVVITSQRWYHPYVTRIAVWLRRNRKPAREVSLHIFAKFTEDWEVAEVNNVFYNEIDEGVPITEVKLYRCPNCILYNKKEDLCNHKKCKVNIDTWEDKVPEWCPLNNGEGIVDKN